MTLDGPEPLFEIVLTGWSNGEVTADHMSFHGPHTLDDVRAVLIAYLSMLGPPVPAHVRTVRPPLALEPQGAAA